MTPRKPVSGPALAWRIKKQAPGLSDLNDEYPGACQPTLVSVGLGPNGLTQYSVKQLMW
jgi:hypothetical protein